MALPKLRLTLPQEGYSYSDGESVLRAKLSTGPSRQRLDMLGAPGTLDLNLMLGPAEYQYYRAFYRTTLIEGSLPFLIDIVIDSSDVTEHEVKIIPGTHRLAGLQGTAHMVQMQLEVKTKPMFANDNAVIMLYSLYGDNAVRVLDRLAKLVNVDFPDSLG